MILVHTVSMFAGYMGPRASKNAFTAYTAITGGKKNVHFGPILGRFCMEILVTLSLSFKKAPIGFKIFFFFIIQPLGAHTSLSLKGLVDKFYRAFKMSVGVLARLPLCQYRG